jgi:hypothetical protein
MPRAEKVRDGETPSPAFETHALPKQSQSDVENCDQCDARREAYQHKLLSMPQHFSQDSVRSEINKSAANVRHN